MDDNFYSPGSADLTDRQRPQGSLVKAVAAGVAIDIVGSLVMTVLVSAIGSFILLSRGHTQASLLEYMQQLGPFSAFNLIIILLGIVMSGVGGYVCASMANRHNYRPVLIMAILSGMIGFLLNLIQGMFQEMGLTLALMLLSFVSVLAGGWLHQRTIDPEKRRTE